MNIRANFVFAYLEGTDLQSKNAGRNYSFSSSLYEMTAVYEYSIIPENNPVNYSLGSLWDGLRSNDAALNTYVFGGLGFSYFDVELLSDPNLSVPSKTSLGQHAALVVPVGAGIKYPVTSNIHLSLEVGGRWTTTDFLDGYTNVKASTANDIYYFSMMNVVIKIDTYSRRRFGR